MIKDILLVEDDLSFALGLRMQLEELYPEAKIVHCETSDEAFAVLTSESIDLVLIDVVLEDDQAGITLGKLAQFHQVPFIFITGFARDDLFERALQLKPDNYLQKPVSIRSLKYAVELAVNGRKPSGKRAKNAPPSSLLLRTKAGMLEKVMVDDILYLEAFGNYCHIATADKKYVHRMPIKSYAEMPGMENFVRVYRNYVINIKHLTHVDTGAQEILLGDIRLPYSKKYKAGLMDKLVQ